MSETRILYRDSVRRAEWGVAFVVVVAAAVAVQRTLTGQTALALLFAGLALAVLVVRLVRGPMRGARLIELGPSDIVIRQPFYVPTKTERVPLDHLAALAIVGGKGDRHFRFTFDDGRVQEIRPRYGPLFEPKAIAFLTSGLPERVRVVEEPPANWLARAHGNF